MLFLSQHHVFAKCMTTAVDCLWTAWLSAGNKAHIAHIQTRTLLWGQKGWLFTFVYPYDWLDYINMLFLILLGFEIG